MKIIDTKNYLKSKSTIQSESQSDIVTRWDFPPKSCTGWHKHIYDFIVIPITDGILRIENVDNKEDTFRELISGESYTGKAGLEHNVINDSKKYISFIEVEKK